MSFKELRNDKNSAGSIILSLFLSATFKIDSICFSDKFKPLHDFKAFINSSFSKVLFLSKSNLLNNFSLFSLELKYSYNFFKDNFNEGSNESSENNSFKLFSLKN